MGANDGDVPYAHASPKKLVTMHSFYMDQTEITNNEYRQFVYWVRDSLARRILGEEDNETWLVPTYDNELQEKDPEPPVTSDPATHKPIAMPIAHSSDFPAASTVVPDNNWRLRGAAAPASSGHQGRRHAPCDRKHAHALAAREATWPTDGTRHLG